MKRTLFGILLLCAFLMFVGAPAFAHDYDSDDSDYPLRYAAYVVHPIGILVEYSVLRPIHWVVSRPHLRVVFGHDPMPGDKYFEWKAGVNDKEWQKAKAAAKAKRGEECPMTKAMPACDAVPTLECRATVKPVPAPEEPATDNKPAVEDNTPAESKCAPADSPATEDAKLTCPECRKSQQ